MKNCSVACAVAASLVVLTTAGAHASSLPAVKAGVANKVPECATPGRMMAFLATRNAKLDARFSGIATAYMRHGEELGVRWDHAFFQMILETGSLAYMRGNGKPGDVKPTQNNFAGLGATGGGAPGETFKSVDDGVKAHLQHLLMYSGERVDGPVAERTRKVQEWGVLTAWQKGFKRPITFADVAGKWAPGSRGYVGDMKSISANFYDDLCQKADPKPELVQEARKGRSGATKVARGAPERSVGDAYARQALERAREEGNATRSALGAKEAAAAVPGVKVLNEANTDAANGKTAGAQAGAQTATATATAAAGAKAPVAKGHGSSSNGGGIVTAAVVVPKTPPAATAPAAEPATGKCRVWTASYGGQKAVIIRSAAEQFTNFTVLDVNEGQESREVEAYISAYAKGGQKIADFADQNAALDKAFQMCPEG